MKKFVALCALTATLIFTGASVWEGSAAVSVSGELPDGAYYAATNSFPYNTVVEVTNLENGRTIQVIVAADLNSPGLLALLSQNAAAAIGIPSRGIGRIRMIESPEPADYSRSPEERPAGGEEAAWDDPEMGVRTATAVDLAAATPADRFYSSVVNRPETYTPQPADYPVDGAVRVEPRPNWIPGQDEFAQDFAETPYPASPLNVSPASPSPYASAQQPVPAPQATQAPSPYASAPQIAPESLPYTPAPQIAPGSSPYYTPAPSPYASAPQATPAPSPYASAQQTAPSYMPGQQTVQALPPYASAAPAPQAALPSSPSSPVIILVPAEERPPQGSVTIPPGTIIGPIPLNQLGPLADRIAAPDSRYFISPIVRQTDPVPQRAATVPREPAPQGVVSPAPPLVSNGLILSVPIVTQLERDKYYVQVGAFTRSDVLETAAARFGRSYPLAVQSGGSPGSLVYRLLVGPLNAGESGAVLQRVKTSGFPDAFVRNGS